VVVAVVVFVEVVVVVGGAVVFVEVVVVVGGAVVVVVGVDVAGLAQAANTNIRHTLPISANNLLFFMDKPPFIYYFGIPRLTLS
jgi:hypothetical protein